jgi:hypothetical protein
MRTTIAGAITIALVFVAPFLWERIMSTAPEIVWRIVFFLCLLGGLTLVALSEPVYTRLLAPRAHPLTSSALVAILAATAVGGAWWFLVAYKPTQLVSIRLAKANVDGQLAVDVINNGEAVLIHPKLRLMHLKQWDSDLRRFVDRPVEGGVFVGDDFDPLEPPEIFPGDRMARTATVNIYSDLLGKMLGGIWRAEFRFEAQGVPSIELPSMCLRYKSHDGPGGSVSYEFIKLRCPGWTWPFS